MTEQVICECGRPLWIAESAMATKCPACGRVAELGSGAELLPPADAGEILVFDFLVEAMATGTA